MIRRATWRTVPGEPETVVGWMPSVLLETPSLLLLFEGGVALIGVVAHNPSLSACVLLLLLVGFLLPYRSPRPRPELPMLPPPADSFLVGVTVRYRGIAIGSDDAIAAFADGWLYVEGRHASFGLRATDARVRQGLSMGALLIDLGRDHTLALDLALYASEAHALRRKEQPSFITVAREWIAARQTPPGEPILPPLTVQPAVYARKLVRAVLLMAVCLAGIFGVVNDRAYVLLGMAFYTLLIFVPLHTVTTYGILRRLDAGTRRGLPNE